jgi:hypothetical protein
MCTTHMRKYKRNETYFPCHLQGFRRRADEGAISGFSCGRCQRVRIASSNKKQICFPPNITHLEKLSLDEAE